jgi:hypothetical protein
VTRDDVRSWLGARRPAPPAGFAAHLELSLPHGREPLPELLAGAGAALLRRVVSAPGDGRELALDLLAADAYVTYAFEAQAEDDVNGLTALAERLNRAGGLA